MLHHRLIIGLIAAMALVAGCAGKRPAADAPPRVATDIDPEIAQASYWLQQPATIAAKSADYQRLFAACEHVLRQRYFAIDTADYRSGAISTRALISQQVWEFWRDDVGDAPQLMNSSLATYRRSVRWVIQDTGGSFSASPWVVVERWTDEPRRITTVVNYRASASSAEAQTRLDSPRLGGVTTSKWFAVGRDKALEADLVRDVQDKLGQR